MSNATVPTTPPPLPSTLLTAAQAAEFLNLTPRFLEMRRFRGGGPKYVRISSRCVRYLQADLMAWIEARRRSSTSDDGHRPSE